MVIAVVWRFSRGRAPIRFAAATGRRPLSRPLRTSVSKTYNLPVQIHDPPARRPTRANHVLHDALEIRDAGEPPVEPFEPTVLRRALPRVSLDDGDRAASAFDDHRPARRLDIADHL